MTNNGAFVHIYTHNDCKNHVTRKSWTLVIMKITHLDHLLRETYVFQWSNYSCFHGNSSESHMVVNS